MFFIFDKQKIYSYLVAASTVAFLFIFAVFLNNDDETIQASANTIDKNYQNVYQNDIKVNNIK